MINKDDITKLEEKLNLRLPPSFKSKLIFTPSAAIISLYSNKTQIRITTDLHKERFLQNPLEYLESIILKFINGRFYK